MPEIPPHLRNAWFDDFSQDAEKNSHRHLPGRVIFVRQFCGQVRLIYLSLLISLSLSVEC